MAQCIAAPECEVSAQDDVRAHAPTISKYDARYNRRKLKWKVGMLLLGIEIRVPGSSFKCSDG